MNRSIHASWCCMVLAAVATVSPAEAGALLGMSVGGQAGVSRTGGDVDKSAFVIGGSTRIEVLSLLTAELAVDYRKENLDAGDITTIPVQISALITPLPLIYGTVGVGWYSIDAKGDLGDQLDELGNISNAALHLGGGVTFPVARRWTAIGDVRYVFLNYDIEEVVGAIGADADFYMITGGLQYELF